MNPSVNERKRLATTYRSVTNVKDMTEILHHWMQTTSTTSTTPFVTITRPWNDRPPQRPTPLTAPVASTPTEFRCGRRINHLPVTIGPSLVIDPQFTLTSPLPLPPPVYASSLRVAYRWPSGDCVDAPTLACTDRFKTAAIWTLDVALTCQPLFLMSLTTLTLLTRLRYYVKRWLFARIVLW